MNSIIETQSVCKTYGQTKAVDCVSLSIPEGSIYGLLGPNGAGKTTLIRMITTITEPDSGAILYKGQALQGKHAALMGYMPEERGLYKKMKVLDQLLFFAEIKGLKRKDARQSAIYWLKKLQLDSWANKKIEELSKGMAQKIQFLCTIIHKPGLLILDEPFSGFDPVNADLIKDLIVELNKNGATIVFSTHRMDNVEELCDYLCIINNGKVAINGEAGSMRRSLFKNEYEAGYMREVTFENIAFAPIKKIITPDGRFIYTFALKDESERDTLLQECTLKGGLVHFSENLPSIHEIFVETVKNNHNV